ncbi:MAG TPA: glycerate kinase [Lacibacter sp.]|nr:glycerate kinase [Lacibacter sp.]HMO88340.1 glycerate kinase [Lacibacter sp.]
MKIILAPDKFKGSLTAFEVCEAMEAGIRGVLPNATVLSFPLADGGDGFGATLKHYLHTQTVPTQTVDPLGRPFAASYEWSEDKATAVVELAAASGLVLLHPNERNPLLTSTYGTGLQIRDAIGRGAHTLLLGLGGSATNDAGTGILAALGFRFFDAAGATLVPCGGNLHAIERVEVPAALPTAHWIIACDVNNPLHGANGAAFVYAPQKGADAAMVQQLDEGLRHFERVINRYATAPVGAIPGTGAAGGVVAGLLPWLNPAVVSGIDLVMEASGLEQALPGADLLLTGEGKLDNQSLQGKVVGPLAALGRKHKVPVAAVCGIAEADVAQLQQAGISRVVQLLQPGRTAGYCMEHARRLVTEETAGLLRAAGNAAARQGT